MVHQIALMVYLCTYRSFLVDKSLALLRTNEIPCANLEKPVKIKELEQEEAAEDLVDR